MEAREDVEELVPEGVLEGTRDEEIREDRSSDYNGVRRRVTDISPSMVNEDTKSEVKTCNSSDHVNDVPSGDVPGNDVPGVVTDKDTSEGYASEEDTGSDVECITLCIPRSSTQVSVLRSVLEYIDCPFEICLGDTEDITLRVPEDFSNGNEPLDIIGFDAAFMTLTRLAHLFPSDALNAGVVMQYFEMCKRASLDEIEAVLEENHEKDTQWFVPGFTESTAVDFFLIHKLTFERCVNGYDYSDYPFITKYLESDPSLKTADTDDEREPAQTSRVAMYCTIC